MSSLRERAKAFLADLRRLEEGDGRPAARAAHAGERPINLTRRGLFGWLAALTGAAAASRVAPAEAEAPKAFESAWRDKERALDDARALYGMPKPLPMCRGCSVGTLCDRYDSWALHTARRHPDCQAALDAPYNATLEQMRAKRATLAKTPEPVKMLSMPEEAIAAMEADAATWAERAGANSVMRGHRYGRWRS